MRYSLLHFVILIGICGEFSFAQSIAINTVGSTDNARALLDIKSTSKLHVGGRTRFTVLDTRAIF